MSSLPVNFGGVARRPSHERPGVVPPADAAELPNFEENRPIRALKFAPRRPKAIQLPYSDVRGRPTTS